MIIDFFENLSCRFYKENDLSDITWTMCSISTTFKEIFLKFFFPEIQISDDIEIMREVSKDDSRPDFIIRNSNVLYIIENKIGDRNHHFEQYEKTFEVKPERFGYIANYSISQPSPLKSYPIRTWEEFYNLLCTIHVENNEEQSFIDGYCAYLKNVCNLIFFSKPMNIEGIYSLYQLMEILKKLCSRDEDNFIISVYNQGRTFENKHVDNSVAGINFELYLKESQLHVWGWIGIYFSEEIPTICIGFWNNENWGRSIYDLLARADDLTKGKFSSAPYEEDGAYWFNYIDDKETYEEWFNKLSLDNQINQLKFFMDEVFNLISELKNKENGKH